MTNTIEGFRPPAEQGRVERGKHRKESVFSKIGRLISREFGFQSREVRSASDTLRAHAAQLQEQNPHRDPTAVRRTTTTADRVDLGHHSNIVEGQVISVVDHIPSPRAHGEGLSEVHAQQELKQYGAHGSTEPNESEIIGTDAWHKAQEESPTHNPNDVSIGSDAWHKAQEETFIPNPHEASIGENRWATGDEAKAIVQEQQTRIQEQAARAKAEAEDHSNDEIWQARQDRRERLLRMQNSVKPGEYTPDVIGAQPASEEDQHQKAA